MKIRENFLPIPDAPNYEVNSQFLVRNKKTGRILKTSRGKVFFRDGNKAVSRLTVTLRHQAVAAAEGGHWEPVPTLGYRYEINIHGKLRNAKTKKLLKVRYRSYYDVCVDGKAKRISIKNLLWETHGIIPTRHKRTPISIVAECNGVKMYFKTIAALAKYLAPKIFYAVSTLKTHFAARIKSLAGWTFTYILPQDLTAAPAKSKCHKVKNNFGAGKCLICGRKFQRRFNGEKFCSDKCRAQNPLRRYLVNALVGRS